MINLSLAWYFGISFIVFGLPALDRVHVMGMPEDERGPLIAAPIDDPVAKEHSLHPDGQVILIGSDQLDERL